MSKRAEWNGDERTPQYYGLRKEWKWDLSDKTSDPVKAMQITWPDLDVVMLMAMSPRPQPQRDHRRFEELYEVVDLGRNCRKAEIQLRELQLQADDEKNLQFRAAERRVEIICDEIIEAGEVDYDRLSRSIKRIGVYDWLVAEDDKVAEFLIAGYIANMLEDVRSRCERKRKDVDDILHRLGILREKIFRNLVDDPDPYSLVERITADIRRCGASDLVDKIDMWIAGLKKVEEARTYIRDRERRLKALGWIDEVGVSADEGVP